ncbi:zinc-dependent metalloprotease [Bifidobacterium eulemuris]|uniref:Hydrolase n=1 Tax=Bifidobacterium eulemuris TaxID=1765219 RepID=A0A261G7C8_9BIFI|nr:zinc-dependent metalloprotease [Bifidobacterium eulemuris]OZG67318.1 hydrolase [Bifidobacterium eulemuris]QOL32900.1 zinc-dependent metalloprotease [Bifidobacterium eulemuris]
MDDNAIHEWLIKCFGPIQGEMAWQQISQLPEHIREQLMDQDPSRLPDPAQVQQLMAAFTAGGLNTMGDMQRTLDEGPINVKLAKSIALQQANAAGAATSVSAQQGEAARRAISEANLWLDTACQFDPAPGESDVLTRADWVEGTIGQWAKFAAPVAESMSDAMSSVVGERLGDAFEGEVAGMFAGPVPIPIPDGMNNPAQLLKLLGNTSYAMQLGQAAGNLSHEVHGSFDQGIMLLKNPAGALIAQNVEEYATSLGIDADEVTAFLALREVAHARLFAAVPWLMPRFEALIGKYARGITIDLDAMEEQLRDATSMDPESISGAVNLTKVGIPDTPEQREAMASLETLLALVEGWVDCVVWRAGMAHIPHIEQMREMMRRERAVGGPAERTFESLLGLELRPKRMREAAGLWEMITVAEGPEARDARWGHPDLLPALSGDAPQTIATPDSIHPSRTDSSPAQAESTDASGMAETSGATGGQSPSSPSDFEAKSGTIDWDAELSKLLGEAGGTTDKTDDSADDATDSSTDADSTR